MFFAIQILTNTKMKKIFIALFLSVMVTGVTFASFPVSTTSNNTEATVSENNAVIKDAAVAIENTVEADASEVSTKTKATKKAKKAADKKVIAIILGLLSVLILPFAFHNWYLGKKKKALWQTLMVFPGFILLGLPALASWIWQIIDLIVIIASGVE